jgi:hypothetical protein
MFPPTRTSTIRQRALGALGLARSFLLLEDDTAVDWEVGQDERVEVDHPHRAALRHRAIERRLAQRRPGQGAARDHVCLCPISAAAPAPAARAARLPTAVGAARRAS